MELNATILNECPSVTEEMEIDFSEVEELTVSQIDAIYHDCLLIDR